MNGDADGTSFEGLLGYLKLTRGFDFTGYKRTTLTRRFTRRMQSIGVERFSDYVDYLEVHPDEFALLFDAILINVTEFFRDASAWHHLATAVVPAILASKDADEPIRVWSAGCAAGQEAYTLAMVLAEALGMRAFRDRVKIYGTDADEDALATARAGVYQERDVASVPDELRDRYFERSYASYSFRKDLRRSVVFGRHDLTSDAPISRLDLLLCRNTLMYFNVETQGRILERFHFGLRTGGFLFLGKAETLLTQSSLFAPEDLRYRIFTKVGAGGRTKAAASPAGGTAGVADRGDTPIASAAFELGAVPQMVVDVNGLLTMANERARTLFAIDPGDLDRPLQDLEVSYRPVELRSCIERAREERAPVRVEDVVFAPSADGPARHLEFEVVPIFANGHPLGASISVHDVTDQHRLEEELQASNRQLLTAYEELQSTNEELETTNEELQSTNEALETTNEELQSTNEELETTNEELQSTNEELETMNEELQSTNEEMHTINEELRDRSDELNEVNAYLESILTSLQTGVAVVDREVLVRVWNQRAEDLWGVRPEEVQGKNFLNLDIGLPVEKLRQPIRSVLSSLSAHDEAEIVAVNRRGKRIRCKVTASPLASAGAVTGAILLMENAGSAEDDGD